MLDPRIPAIIKVLSQRLRVIESPGLMVEQECSGSENAALGWIKIDPIGCGDHQCMVAVHEVLHVLNTRLCLGLDADTLVRLGHGLYQVLVDNDLRFGAPTEASPA